LPPPSSSFDVPPQVKSRHPLWRTTPEADGSVSVAAGLPVAAAQRLMHARHGRRETLGVDPVSGLARDIIVLPGSSWLPLLCALGLAGVCLGLLFTTWVLAVVAALVSLVLM